MLDRTRDADGDIQTRRNDLASLADLQVIRRIARIDRCTAGTDGRAQLICQGLEQREPLFRAKAAPARDDNPSGRQVGAITTCNPILDPGRQGGCGGRIDADDRRRTGCRTCGGKGGGAQADHLDCIARLHLLHRIAGIDRTQEGVRAQNTDHIGQDHYIQQRRDAWQGVFAGRRCWGQNVAICASKRHDQICHAFGDLVIQRRRLRPDHPRYAVDMCGRISRSGRPRDQYCHIAQGARAGDRTGGRIRDQRARLHFGQNQNSHQITPAAFSFATSSSTEATISPAARAAGSRVSNTLRRGVRSTPRVAASTASIGFFLAFIILGSEVKRGSFRRRSAVTTAGSGSATVCKPPSTSRVIVATSPSTATAEAKVPCPQPSSAANIWPVAFISSSIACLPAMTSLAPSERTTLFNSLATANGSGASLPSGSCTKMARSAPMPMALRKTSSDALVPTETATTSTAKPASFRRNASSTAISSKGLIDIFRLASSTPVPSGRTRTFTLWSTTRLTGTRIFIRFSYSYGQSDKP
ncbi:hypothetical protein KVU_2561 [Ketogulonicigenium vulgare WSH-001]|uniref:Uncharacterized protein n=1 Tax=Ketogulonicigenium vulgare (strain WSH-001) TaxID=759362 RepID=F9Y8B4_KETVW|nr:hypothetical protein KVU_2561 [Ketogulonicigenium vulgare WSH-001]